MKNIFLTMMAVALLVVGLTACGGYDKHPFKDISETYLNTVQKIIDDPSLVEDMEKDKSLAESFAKNFENKMHSLAEDLYGKTIKVEISDGLGFEVVSNEGRIGEGDIHGDNLHFPINIDLKSIDESLARDNLSKLVAYFCDEDGKAVYVEGIGEECPLKKGQEVESDTRSLDSMVKEGSIIHRGIRIGIEFSDMQPFLTVSKIVIEKYDYDKSREIEDRNREMEKEFIRKVKEAARHR